MQNKLRYITHFSAMLALTLVFQMGGFPQPITGPLINMMLYLTAIHLGLIGGVTLGTLTPLIALWRGQLPAILAPMVPFIVIGNAVLVFVYLFTVIKLKRILTSEPGWQKNLRISAGIILSALIKFIILFIGVTLIVPVLFGVTFPEAILNMMAAPQLVTALVGGCLAALVSRLLWRAGVFKRPLNE